MSLSWEQIQQALGAEIRGEERQRVVSQRTLFGIPNSIEVRMAKISEEVTRDKARKLEGSTEQNGSE